MTRFYYTDPLAAAWMAKHFGMEFSDGSADFLPEWNGTTLVGSKQANVKIYIHSDSVKLLEPIKNDLVVIGKEYMNWELDESGDLTAGWIVILRNGIAFMRPKVENDIA